MRMPSTAILRRAARGRAKRLAVQPLEPRMLLASDPVISEFMAINDTTLADGEGDYSDWIEVHNPTAAAVDMDGWFLTDKSDNLTKWRFPSVVIDPGDYLIVFASEDNSPPVGELHANFKLSGSGEYLALVKPDGVSVTTEFDPYPQQVADVAYGLGVDATPSTLAAADDPVRVHVPADGSLGETWTAESFDDSAWAAGTGGVGFDLAGDYDPLIGADVEAAMYDVNGGAYARTAFSVADATAVDTLSLDVQYDDGFVAYLNGQEVASRNAVSVADSPASGLISYWDFEGDAQDKASDYVNNSGTVEDDLTGRGGTERFAAGKVGNALAIGESGGDVTDLRGALSPDVQLPATYTIETWIKPTELSDSWQRLVLNWGGTYPEHAYHFAIRNNGGFVNGVSLFHRQTDGAEPNANGGTVALNQWQHIAGVADGSNLIVYLNGVEVARTPYDGTITTVASEGLGIGDSDTATTTIKYNGLIDELAIWDVPLTESQLRSHYLAGELGYGLTQIGGSTELDWDSTAQQDRDDTAATTVETIDLTPFASTLQTGANVLAVHGLNSAVDNDDFLIRTALQSADVSIRTDVQRYFAAPTPGAANGSGSEDLGPIVGNVQHEQLPPRGVTETPLVQSGDTAQWLVPNLATGPALGDDWIDPSYTPGTHGESWSTAPGGFGFDDDGNFTGLFHTDTAAAMTGINASAYVRHTFDVPAGAAPEQLSLNVQYDDGFVAYLNGEQVARRNAPSDGGGPTATLVHQWKFDGDTLDSSASGNDGTFVGGTETYVAGRSGQAISLADGERVEDTLTANLPTRGADPMTLNLWAKIDAAPPEGAYLAGIGGRTGAGVNGSKRSLISLNDHIYFWARGNDLDTGDAYPVDGQWHMYTVTYDGSTAMIYLDGVEIGVSPKVLVDATNEVIVGSAIEGLSSFAGAIDEFAIWDGVLSNAEIQDVMNFVTPEPLSWDSTATAEHDDAAAVVAEQIDLTDHLGLLQPTGNVLAVQALNRSDTDADFLMTAELVGLTGGEQFGTIRVTAEVLPTLQPIDTVTLHHRVMFDAEQTVAMVDNGLGEDAAAGDGIYTGLIPLDIVAPGEMIRWYVTADDVTAVATRNPLFPDPNNSPEYYGTVLDDPAIVSQLPVLHRFVAVPSAAETRSGTRASVYYQGEFYDNVFLRMRGQTSANWPKKSYKIDFNDGHHFRFHPDYPRVEEINLNNTYTDKSYMRRVLAYETFRDAGSPYSETFPIRIEQNGEFWTVSHIVEQVDRDYLRRNDLDDDGALYKAGANNFTGTATNGFSKKNRRDEDFSDLQAFIDGLAQADGSVALEQFIFDNVNLPGQISYMAANIINQNIDRTVKNYYAYRDTEGTGEWQMLPWDVDLTFGPDALNTDVVKANFDGAPDHSSHPFLGGNDFPFRGLWNRLLDVIYKNDRTREMFLRRLRTLMEEILQPPGTPSGQLLYEQRVEELFDAMESDVALDKAKWGVDAHFGSTDPTLRQEVDELKTAYFALRRPHLFETHVNATPLTTVLDSNVAAKALVPTDGSLGLDWTQRVFDDSGWFSGATGVGYDEATDYDALLGIDLRTAPAPADNDTNDDGTSDHDSVYIRIPFEVTDPAALTQLTLRMKYDDGFVAYINGTRVAGANDPASPVWNSPATGQHDDGVALVFQDFDISSYGGPGGVLVTGTNVLAIHGLNDDTNGTGTSSDMLLLPEIVNGSTGAAGAVGIPLAQVGNPTITFASVEYNPASGNQDEEYIELFNPNATAVDVSGWQLTGGVEHTFAPGAVILAGESLYVSPDVATFRARAVGPSGGQGLFVQGAYDGHISNLGELIELRGADGGLVSSITTPYDPSPAQEFLRVSEVMYNPPQLSQAEIDAGFTDNDQFEFVELVNTSETQTLTLDGVALTRGIEFTFPDTLPGTPETTLPPGERIVLVYDLAAFDARYGAAGITIGGQYGELLTGGNRLNNDGEVVKLEDAQSSTIQQFDYNDNPSEGWPAAADGAGSSLEVVNTASDYDAPTTWYASVQSGGSPGVAAAATVLGRHVFYDNSAFDNMSDDLAIATDKSPLLYGQTATVANYTNYDKGINGVIVDLANPTAWELLDDTDFTFLAGNTSDTATWTPPAAAPVVTVRHGEGLGGSDRVVITWPADAPTNTWLQITARSAATDTGLLADDVFLFGNAVGETGNSSTNAMVTAADLIAIRNNPRGAANRADLDNPLDINRDMLVDVADALLARNHASGPFSALALITPQPPAPAPPEPAADQVPMAADQPVLRGENGVPLAAGQPVLRGDIPHRPTAIRQAANSPWINSLASTSTPQRPTPADHAGLSLAEWDEALVDLLATDLRSF